MVTRTVEQVDDWEAVPFSGGYDGLRDLADDDFSGVVTSGPAKLFMLGGSVIGVLEGSIEDFEGADGTARRAPHRALPLLALMQERSDEVRAKYYTEDTSIAEVDRTLSDGGFTGYVELSENVLSGDYYQVYHQGRSMSVAWVGSAERLVTDDEAFEQANDEVGIFEVRPVDVDVIDIPDSGGADAGAAGAGARDGTGSDEPTGAAGESTPDGTTGAAGESTPDAPAGADGSVEPSTGAPSGAEAGESVRSATDEPADDAGTPTGVDAGSAPAGAKAAGGRSPGRDRSGVDDSTESAGREGADAGSETTGPSARESAASDERAPAREGSTAAADDSRADRSAADETTARETGQQRGADGDARTDDREAGDAGVRQSDADRRSTGNGADRTGSEVRSEAAERRRRTGRSRSGATDDAGRSPSSTDRGRSADAVDRAQSQAAGASPAVDGASGQASSEAGAGPEQAGPAAGSAGGAADLEVRSIPSLDPAQTEAASAGVPGARPEPAGENGGATADVEAGPTPADDRPAGGEPTGTPARDEPVESTGNAGAGQERTSEPATTGDSGATDGPAGAGRSTAGQEGDLRADLAEARERADDLESELARVESERDQLREERDDLAAERDELQADLAEARDEIERLERRVEELAEDSATAGAETRLGPGEAIDQTNLFVRYDSKGEATLETAHDGDADRSTVDSNLRLEYHTQFDADSTAVGDQSFDEFLRGTVRYRFVDWLVRNLIYEIRDTGNADTMTDLYDALPKVDRAELNGQISVEYTEDGETQRTQERFDVVVRDRMGNPLVVANINDSRDPATQSMMTELVTRAERVGGSSDSLAGAFLVTESFFEPGALETAEEETSSGLFSRDKRKSFVNLSRKSGFHLCLVEARNQEFHLAVPEL